MTLSANDFQERVDSHSSSSVFNSAAFSQMTTARTPTACALPHGASKCRNSRVRCLRSAVMMETSSTDCFDLPLASSLPPTQLALRKEMLVTGVTEVSHLVSLVPQSWRSRDRLYRHGHSLLDLRPFPALSAHGLSRRPPRGEIITTRGILLGTPARFRPVFVVQHRDLTAHGYHL